MDGGTNSAELVEGIGGSVLEWPHFDLAYRTSGLSGIATVDRGWGAGFHHRIQHDCRVSAGVQGGVHDGFLDDQIIDNTTEEARKRARLFYRRNLVSHGQKRG